MTLGEKTAALTNNFTEKRIYRLKNEKCDLTVELEPTPTIRKVLITVRGAIRGAVLFECMRVDEEGKIEGESKKYDLIGVLDSLEKEKFSSSEKVDVGGEIIKMRDPLADNL